MAMSDDDWQLVLMDHATNHLLDDYTTGIVHHPTDLAARQPVMVAELEHCETGERRRITMRIAPTVVVQLAQIFDAMVTDLRRDGAVT